MMRFFKILIRIFSWFVAGLIVLLCLATLLLQTTPVKKQIARIAEQQAKLFLKAELKIGKLEGNFFTHIRLNKISLTQEEDTIASINELDLQYELWPLLKKQIIINHIDISQPVIHLAQTKDSTWNLSSLVKEQSTPAETSTTNEPFNWKIDLQRLKISSGLITTTTADSLIPNKIDDISIQLRARYRNNEQELNLDTFRLNCIHPNIQLQQLSFNLKQTDGTVYLSQFVLQTDQNKLEGSARYAENESSSLNLESEPVSCDEFQFALPDLQIKVHPEISWATMLQNDSLNSDISLTDNEQRIHININAHPFMAWLNTPNSVNLRYSLNGNFENVKVEEWSGIANLAALLNGSFQIRGKGTDPETLKLQANAKIQNTSIAGYQIEQFSTQNDYLAGNLSSRIDLKTNFAKLSATAEIQDLLNTPKYEARMQSTVFSLSPFIEADSLDTHLHMQLSAQGSDFDPRKMRSQIQLLISPSTIMSIPVDSAFANLRFRNQIITVDTLTIRNQSVRLAAKGTYNLDGQSDLKLNANISSLSAFKTFLPDTTNLVTNTNIQTRLSGIPDSLQIETNAQLLNSKYGDFKIEEASLKTHGLLSPTGIELKTNFNAQHFSASGFELDSIDVESTVHNKSIELTASVRNEFLETKLNAGVNWDKELKIKLEKWFLSVYDQHWHLTHPSQFVIDSTSFQVNQFALASNNDATISIDGIFDQQGELDMHFDIDRLDLKPLLQPIKPGSEIKGRTQLKLALSGTSQLPVLESHLQIDSLSIDSFGFQEAEASLHYRNRILKFDSKLAMNDQGTFAATGSTPLLIDLSEMKTFFSPDSSMSANAKIQDLPLALIQPFIPASEIAGLINGAFQFEGSINSPEPSGNIGLTHGSLKIEQFGIDYRDMKLNTNIEKETISIDTLGIVTADGKLTGGGKLFFDSVFYNGQIKESTLNIRFDKFNPIDHKQINMQLSGDVGVSGKNDTIVFSGDLSIPQSEIYLSALLNLFGKVYTPEIPTPILVQELEKQEADTSEIQENFSSIQLNDSLESSSLSNLIGRIKLKIPKNTWIKDPNLRVELSGDLEILKNPNNVEIFGAINVVRGQYELFGRTFIVSEGTVTFEGGKEINPRLNLTATYTIKSRNTDSRTLAVTAGGTAMAPTISFTLDDKSITEGDALSYIIFGKGLNELSVSEQDNVSDVTGETMAKSAAASLLASQLTRFLGSKINVDYIDVQSQDDFDNASLEVGKYITSDIFISYEQQFGNNSDDDLSRYEVRLEYEIFRFLFLQLNNSSKDSGFDVIFKIQTK